MTPRRDRFLRALPLAVAFAVWLAGTSLVMRHVLRGDDWIMRQVREQGLVDDLFREMLPFLPVYLLAGALSIAAAWAILLPYRTRERRGAREGIAGTLLLLTFLAASTLYGARAQPASFAGLFYGKGGALRALQIALERPPLDAPVPPPARAAAPVASAPARPNVLMIVVDSLRPDRVFGPSAAARTLRDFREESATFLHAATPLARTYGSMTSLLTGLHPIHHGVRTLYPDRAARTPHAGALPRRLAAAGYRTIAVGGYCATVLREVDLGFAVQRTPRSEVGLIVSAAALRAHPLMPVWLRGTRLRDLFPILRDAVEAEDPAEVAADAIASWREARGPFFEVVFFGNPHQPYVPAAGAAAAPGRYAGPNRYSITAGDLVEQVRIGVTGGAARRDAAEADNLRRLYDGAVRGVDRAVGDLLAALDRDGLADDTMVVVLADHGENLLDAGGPLAHGERVERDRSNEVPLLVRWRGRIAPRRIDEPVSLVDLAPTIADAAGIGGAAAGDGVSLWPALTGGAPPPARAFLLETCIWFDAEQVADSDPLGGRLTYPDFTAGLLSIEPGDVPHIVVAPRWLATVYRAKERRLDLGSWSLAYLPREGEPGFRLYDRAADPWLTRDLAASEPARLAEMKRAFYAEITRLGDPFVPVPAAATAAER